MAQLGRYLPAQPVRYRRAQRVVVRTARGLEVGEVLGAAEAVEQSLEPDGTILRPMTVEDELVEARLLKNRQAALEHCERCLREKNLPVALLDVEHLFDGQTLVFYFLGEPTAELERLTAELAEAYEAKAQIGAFADLLATGCGPDCGTEHAASGGCGSCAAGCPVAAACRHG